MVIDEQLVTRGQWARDNIEVRLTGPLISLQKRRFELALGAARIDNRRVRSAERSETT